MLLVWSVIVVITKVSNMAVMRLKNSGIRDYKVVGLTNSLDKKMLLLRGNWRNHSVKAAKPIFEQVLVNPLDFFFSTIISDFKTYINTA